MHPTYNFFSRILKHFTILLIYLLSESNNWYKYYKNWIRHSLKWSPLVSLKTLVFTADLWVLGYFVDAKSLVENRKSLPKVIPKPSSAPSCNSAYIQAFVHYKFSLSRCCRTSLTNKNLINLFKRNDEMEHVSVHDKDKVELERPVTPIDEEIRVPPSTFDKLCKLVRRRVAPKPKISSLSISDQKELVCL